MLDISNMNAKNMQLRLEAISYIRVAITVRSDTGVCHAPLSKASALSMGLDRASAMLLFLRRLPVYASKGYAMLHCRRYLPCLCV